MVRYGMVPTKLKNRHLTLKQDLHCLVLDSDVQINSHHIKYAVLAFIYSHKHLLQ